MIYVSIILLLGNLIANFKEDFALTSQPKNTYLMV